MTNEEYIHLYRREDTRKLALKRVPDGVDIKYCLRQIEGWQIACRKLPRWSSADGLQYPPRLAMEQCSSEQTACYKRDVVMRLLPPEGRGRRSMADLTGGFGVDFSFLSPCFDEAFYVERQEELCALARHNFPLLNLPHAQVVCADVDATSPLLQRHFSFLFLDPARRDEMGKKTFLVEDCAPDVRALHDVLLRAAPLVMIKLSPMLDIAAALRVLPNVSEVHVVSVAGECKELLLVLRESDDCQFFCVNLGSTDPCFSVGKGVLESAEKVEFIDALPEGGYLFEPNASILKAGLQDVLCSQLSLEGKLHPHSHLYVNRQTVSGFPGRMFRIVGWCGFDKRGLKDLLRDVPQANLTLRNFPSSTDALRRRLRLREGGDVYLFATTMADGTHIMIRCEKVQEPGCPDRLLV